MAQDELRIGQQRLVDAQPKLDEGLPRRAHLELGHALPGCLFESEALR